MKISRTPKSVQNAQKQATRDERHTMKGKLRVLPRYASDDDLDEFYVNLRKQVKFDRSKRSLVF